jgi:hypothetical protein
LCKVLEVIDETFTPPGGASRWRQLRQMALIQEREMRQQDLLAPCDEETFLATLLWAIQQGQEQELAILREIRPSPPHSSPDAVKLMEEAEHRITARLRTRPLPDSVRRIANAYTMTRLGDALQPEHAGTVVAEGGVTTWQVKVRQQLTGALRGVLSIREDNLTVEWIPGEG